MGRHSLWAWQQERERRSPWEWRHSPLVLHILWVLWVWLVGRRSPLVLWEWELRSPLALWEWAMALHSLSACRSLSGCARWERRILLLWLHRSLLVLVCAGLALPASCAAAACELCAERQAALGSGC